MTSGHLGLLSTLREDGSNLNGRHMHCFQSVAIRFG